MIRFMLMVELLLLLAGIKHATLTLTPALVMAMALIMIMIEFSLLFYFWIINWFWAVHPPSWCYSLVPFECVITPCFVVDLHNPSGICHDFMQQPRNKKMRNLNKMKWIKSEQHNFSSGFNGFLVIMLKK